MTKLDDAYNRLDRFETLLRKRRTFVPALIPYDEEGTQPSFAAVITALCDDIRTVMAGIDEREEYREILHDLVMIDSEERAIGGGPGFRARRDKAWARASEPFEP